MNTYTDSHYSESEAYGAAKEISRMALILRDQRDGTLEARLETQRIIVMLDARYLEIVESLKAAQGVK